MFLHSLKCLLHSFRDGNCFVLLSLFIKYTKKSQFNFSAVCVFLSQGDLKNAVVIDEKAEDTNVKGIPDFWFTIFRNVDMLSELVQVSFFSEMNNFCCVKWIAAFPVNSQSLWSVSQSLGVRHQIFWVFGIPEDAWNNKQAFLV